MKLLSRRFSGNFEEALKRQRLGLLDDPFNNDSSVLLYCSESRHLAEGRPFQSIVISKSLHSSMSEEERMAKWAIHNSSHYEWAYRHRETGRVSGMIRAGTQDEYTVFRKYLGYGGHSCYSLRNDAVKIGKISDVSCGRCKKSISSKKPKNINIRFIKGHPIKLSEKNLFMTHNFLNIYDWRIFEKDGSFYFQRFFNDTDLSNTVRLYFKNDKTIDFLSLQRVRSLRLSSPIGKTMKAKYVNPIPVFNYIMLNKDKL